ncbi:aldo/keto reductase [Mangrovicoccus algicola]|uniref:Aldo/keto reductase n=1 Tax=Mangrovicoccus algicola TaxID=2771008 RepID=A0A8J6YZ04_9RHOB|nr:aldo/keto reductase [Mangrovicoccus algicola]MBE3638393.1 aldo/keto reductase [Mangrovicoccus algicola]
MERVPLAPDLSLSRLVCGLWRIGDGADTSPAHVAAKLEACLAQGITSLDLADIYGGYATEAILGDALRARPGLRERMEIVTKCGIVAPVGRHAAAAVKHYDTSRAHIHASVEQSLRDLGTDRIDLLLIHRPDPLMDHEETGQALDDLLAAGKVRAVGVSNFRPWDVELLESRMAAPLVANQIEISLARPAPFTDGDLAFHQRRQEAVMAWSPLGGGSLMTAKGPLGDLMDELALRHGTDRAAIATAFLLAHPARILPVLGTTDPARIARIGAAARIRLERQDWFRLYQAALGREVP